MHNGGKIVRRINVFPRINVDLGVIGCSVGNDILEKDIDVIISICARLLVLESKSVEELVLDYSDAHAVRTKIEVLSVPEDMANVRPAALLQVQKLR